MIPRQQEVAHADSNRPAARSRRQPAGCSRQPAGCSRSREATKQEYAWWDQEAARRQWEHVDEHRARAAELAELGHYREAIAVLGCRLPSDLGRPQRRCRTRWCPTCAAVDAGNRQRSLLLSLQRMQGPRIAVVFGCRSVSSTELHDAVRRLKRDLRALLRHPSLRGVHGLAAVLEVKLDRGTLQWIPHLHCVLDVTEDIDSEAIDSAWSKQTERRGWFSLDPKMPIVRDEGMMPFASYATKTGDTFPAPGTLPLDLLGVPFRCLKGVHLLVRTGSANPRRRPSRTVRTISEAGPAGRSGTAMAIEELPGDGSAQRDAEDPLFIEGMEEYEERRATLQVAAATLAPSAKGVAYAVAAYACDCEERLDSAVDLLAILRVRGPTRALPRTPSWLSRRLRAAAPALEAAGVAIARRRTRGGRRGWRVRLSALPPLPRTFHPEDRSCAA